MSISAINAAAAAELGQAGTLIGSTLHYIDGGRIQLVALTLLDEAGKRQNLIRPLAGRVDLSDGVKGMVIDWKSGALEGIAS